MIGAGSGRKCKRPGPKAEGGNAAAQERRPERMSDMEGLTPVLAVDCEMVGVGADGARSSLARWITHLPDLVTNNVRLTRGSRLFDLWTAGCLASVLIAPAAPWLCYSWNSPITVLPPRWSCAVEM